MSAVANDVAQSIDAQPHERTSRLSAEAVRRIFLGTDSLTEAAIREGVSRVTVSFIRNRKRRSNLTRELQRPA